MLKSLLHIWLSMIIVLNSMIFSVIQMDYALNKEYITENFCINKDKPEMHCDGKCFLSEQLQDAKEQQEQKNGGINFNRDFGIFILLENSIAFNSIYPPYFVGKPIYKERNLSFHHSDIFHPPQSFA
ncbi:hypothetical protein IFO69_14410 [Echinicola sp. CAU 1574]|uniref:Uncharacterized protein n=1 Tax=Echinicola arenosa TaxID=2774144 RepID=A0ABR9AMD2_9BACT|nr:hypothetical protein [Echinicola arenosa]MBD8489946.1 hypothetical protein [Echinicola arenosa]